MNEFEEYQQPQYADDIAFEYSEMLIGVRERLQQLRASFPGYSFQPLEDMEQRNRLLFLMWGEVSLILSGRQQPKDYSEEGDEWGIYE